MRRRYVGSTEAGDTVDERITVVLEHRPEDGPHRFLPAIVKMSADEAERRRADEGAGPT